MHLATKIACRTIGAAGIGLALYDTVRVSKHFAEAQSRNTQADYLERRYFDSRTTSTVSYTTNALREKTFDLMTKNPLPALWGKIKGGFQGAMYALGNNLLPIVCGALALTCKGFMAKLGSIGILLGLGFKVLHEGFGVGKKHPMA